MCQWEAENTNTKCVIKLTEIGYCPELHTQNGNGTWTVDKLHGEWFSTLAGAKNFFKSILTDVGRFKQMKN